MEVSTSTTASEFEIIYRDILRPSFTDDELVPLESFLTRIERNSLDVTVVRDGSTPLAVAIGDFFPTSRAVLLSYLAVRADARAGGLGTLVFSTAMDRWVAQHTPALIVAEVENPRYFHSDALRGDPSKRIRFYEKMGGAIIDIPYFQPPVGVNLPYVFGMVLMAFRVQETLLYRNPSGLSLHSELVRSVLADYGDEFFKPVPESAEAVTDLTAALAPEFVRLLPVIDLADLRYPSLDRASSPR